MILRFSLLRSLFISIFLLTSLTLPAEYLSAMDSDPEVDLKSPVYVKWNTFLGQLNFLELAVKGAESLSIEVSVYNLLGQPLATKSVVVAGGSQKDLDINAIVTEACLADVETCSSLSDIDGSGVIDSYGLVKLEFDDSDANKLLVGRLSNYRPDDGLEAFSFAFARQFRNPNQGPSYAGSNTFDVNGQGFSVPNWVEVINLADTPKSFSVNLYTATGELVRSTGLTLNPLEERDVPAGHDIIDELSSKVVQSVYLVEVVPEDNTADYLMSVSRYSSNSYPGFDDNSYNYAFSLPGRSGASEDVFGMITNEDLVCGEVLNWLEIANVSSTTTAVTVTLRGPEGNPLQVISDSIGPKAQRNYNASAALSQGEIGTVQVESSTAGSVVAQSLVYIFDCDSVNIQTAYMTRLAPAGRQAQVGTGNTFLQMENQLRIASTISFPSLVGIDIFSFLGETGEGSFAVPGFGVSEIDLTLNPALDFQADRYGILSINTPVAGSSVSEVLRVRKKIENGKEKYDFVLPTPLR